VVEQSLWALIVATALEDLGIRGHVWPLAGPPNLVAMALSVAVRNTVGGPPSSARPSIMSLTLDVVIDDIAVAIEIRAPAELLTRATMSVGARGDRAATAVAPHAAATTSWLDSVRYGLPIVVGRCALHRDDLARLVPRTVVTLQRPITAVAGGDADLDLFGGHVGLRLPWRGTRAASEADRGLPATVATGYVPRDMSLPDDAHVELTVALGTTKLSLREITELAVGQIVQLGRPLAGPFELRAAGRVLGRGELVDVDGELAVRIVSLGD
jgi:flagellar motor switch/type III secretory pathway protein FliN